MNTAIAVLVLAALMFAAVTTGEQCLAIGKIVSHSISKFEVMIRNNNYLEATKIENVL